MHHPINIHVQHEFLFVNNIYMKFMLQMIYMIVTKLCPI